MTVQPALTLAPPTDEAEVRAFARLVTQSLFWPPLDEDDWCARAGHENLRVVHEGGAVVAGLLSLPVAQWFGGRAVPSAAVTAVGVAVEARATGVGSAMMRDFVRELHASGVPLATLYPSTQPVYRRAGFEQGGSRITYQLPTAAIDLRDRALDVRPFDPAEPASRDQMCALYSARARQSAGHLDRNDFIWRNLLGTRKTSTYAYFFLADGVPEGYVVYRQQHAPGMVEGEIRCSDLVVGTAGAARRLLTFFADHRSTVGSVRFAGAPAEPLFYHVANQAHTTDWRFDWLLRIVDLRGALEGRGYPADLDTEVHFDVRDAVLPANEGRVVLRVANGRADLREGGRGDLRIDVCGLAALYTGRLSPAELCLTGLLEGEPAALDRAAAVFAGPAPWMPDMF